MAAVRQNSLLVYNIKRGVLICEQKYLQPVKAAKITLNDLFVLVDNDILCYTLSSMKLEKTLLFTEPISSMCAQQVQDKTLLVVGTTAGNVSLFNMESEIPLWSRKVHNSAVSLLELCSNGEHLASASNRGTIIRIISCIDGAELKQLRRGLSSVPLTCIHFDRSCRYLCTAGKSSTVHIFSLGDSHDKMAFAVDGGIRDVACIHLSEQSAHSPKAVFLDDSLDESSYAINILQDNTDNVSFHQYTFNQKTKQCIEEKNSCFEKQ